ncbi:MAG: phosphonate ABC transporter, permease protein PhnE [Hyphomicrobiales bacterium]|nr:phosphonate ABC transporter, permease protein PhnE [Hyphomicrobiales bacterium]
MASAALILPPAQLEPLERAYQAARAAKRRSLAIGAVVFVVCIAAAIFTAEVDLAKLWANVGRFGNYFVRLAFLDNGKPVWTDIAEWYWGFWKWLHKIGETLIIAYLGTLLGGLGAFIFCFLSARNLVQSKTLLFFVRRYLEFCRTVPELVFALTFVVAFGLGPLPGVLALAIHTWGALGKQFCEVVENIDMKPFEGVSSSGATWTEAVRYAALPQVAANFASYGLMRFEINVRGAAIMGFVGAGGIGQDLLEAVRKFYYSDVSAMLLMIVATVTIIDLVTERLRHAILSSGGTR